MSNIDRSIKINTEELRTLIELYEKELAKLEEVFLDYKNETDLINDYWRGDNGEEASNRLKKYNTSFDVIVNNFAENIQFLKNVVAAYGNIEDRISNSTDNVLNN